MEGIVFKVVRGKKNREKNRIREEIFASLRFFSEKFDTHMTEKQMICMTTVCLYSAQTQTSTVKHLQMQIHHMDSKSVLVKCSLQACDTRIDTNTHLTHKCKLSQQAIRDGSDLS